MTSTASSFSIPILPILLGSLLLAGVAPLRAQSVTIVPHYESLEAPGYYHFDTVSGLADAEHDQMMIDGSFFAGPGEPVVIDSIAFRLDKSAITTSATFTDFEIQLSTAATTVSTMSTTLADNVGSDVTTVHSGPITLLSAGGAGSPSDFDIVVPFLTPFTYDPLAGDLLFDWQWAGSFSNNNFVLDTNYSNTAPYTSVLTYMEDSSPLDGFAESVYPGLSVIVEFSISLFISGPAPAVPEPTALLLALLGLALVPRRRSLGRRCARD